MIRTRRPPWMKRASPGDRWSWQSRGRCNKVNPASWRGLIQVVKKSSFNDNRNPMKTLIVGAGMIGVTYGWALSEAGHDVTHFVRSGRKEQLQEGITLDLIDDRKRYPKTNIAKYVLKCVESILPDDHYELIILPLHF